MKTERYRNLIGGVLFLVFLGSAGAQETVEDLARQIVEVSALEDTTERLTEYDALARRLDEILSIEGEGSAPKGSTSVSPTDVGRWGVEATSDPLTDESQVFFMVEATEGGSYLRKPSLIIRQNGALLDVFVAWHEYFSEDYQSVTHRIDRDDPQTLRWSVSTDNSATFYPRSESEFVQELLDAEQLVMRTTPYGDSPMTITFDVRGLREAALPHENLLPGWDLDK